ncbi:MAG: PEGA domain-containing protein [Planctomycetes bacterium]|nr:PEGA domain-containing protein [Planctomycetota bacterium]
MEDLRSRDTVETQTPAHPGRRALVRGILFLLALAVLAAAAAFALSPTLRGRLLRPKTPTVPLQVSSTPEGADVYIDDELAGQTPVRAQVAPGPHRVRVVRRGYKPHHEEVDPATRSEVAYTLQRVQLAALIVECDPEGAVVFLDEERRGTAPIEIRGIEAGPHTLRVLKEPLFQPFTQHVELKDGETRHITVRLDSGLERLYLERIKANPGKLGNYTELLHVQIGDKEPAKAAATVAQAVETLQSEAVTPTELGQFYEEVRKLASGRAGALDPASREKFLAALASALDKLVQAAPSEYPRYTQLVAFLTQADRFEEVYKVCEKAAGGRGLVHYYVATVCLGHGEAANAIRLLERAVALQPTLYTARESLASAYHRADRYDDALRQYAEAEKALPADASSAAYYRGVIQAGIARVLVSKKDIAGAVAHYQRAIATKTSPAYVCQWRLQFAELLLEQGRKQEAAEQYNEIVRVADPDSKAYSIARVQLRRMGEK